MIRTVIISCTMLTAMAVIPVAGAQEVKPDPKPYTQAFLKKAGEMQRAQIELALLVDDRADNQRVRRFGEQMIAAHQKMSQEVQELSAEKGIQLPAGLSDEHKQKLKELSRLSGHAFDRTYMQYILREHQHDTQEFEESMQAVEDPDVLHWSYKTLPMLRAHVEEARWIQQSMQTNP